MTPILPTFEVRANRVGYLFNVVLLGVVLAGSVLLPGKHRESNLAMLREFSWRSAPALLFLYGLPVGSLLLYFLDRGVKLRVDAAGIWTAKAGLVAWSTVWYFYTTVVPGKHPRYYLHVRLKEELQAINEHPLRLHLDEGDKGFPAIRSAIAAGAAAYSIQDMGHEKQAKA